jgi:predicted RNase H-like HicB family nuclease
MHTEHTVLLSIQIEKNNDGYLASVPGIQGAFAEGDSIEEAVFNCVDVVKMISAYRSERGEGIGFNEVEWTPKTRMTIAIPIGVD